MRFDCIHCRKATTKPQSVKGAFLRMLTPNRYQQLITPQLNSINQIDTEKFLIIAKDNAKSKAEEISKLISAEKSYLCTKNQIYNQTEEMTDGIKTLHYSDLFLAMYFGKHSKKCTFYTLRFGCSFAAVNTIKPQLL